MFNIKGQYYVSLSGVGAQIHDKATYRSYCKITMSTSWRNVWMQFLQLSGSEYNITNITIQNKFIW